MSAFGEIASEFHLKLIEDAAQAFGAAWKGIRAGGLGDAAAFSFYPTKNLSAFGDAGMVTTQDAATDARLRSLRQHGMQRRYFHEEIGWNSRLDSLQAAVLEIKLQHVAAGNARRRAIAALYDERFRAAGLVATSPAASPSASPFASPPGNPADNPAASTAASTADGIVLPFTAPPAEPVFHQYVIRVPRRDALREFLTSQGIGSEVYYPVPLHLQPSLAGLGYRQGDFPVSERAAQEVLALPIFPGLRDHEVDLVVDTIRRFFA